MLEVVKNNRYNHVENWPLNTSDGLYNERARELIGSLLVSHQCLLPIKTCPLPAIGRNGSRDSICRTKTGTYLMIFPSDFHPFSQ